MLDNIENRTKLYQLSKGEFIWAMVKCNLFKTYSQFYGDKSETYLGYDSGDPDVDYNGEYALQMAAIPQVHKPMKMSLVGKMVSSEMKDDICYVFCSDLDNVSRGEYKFNQYILRPYSRWRGYHDTAFLSRDISYDNKKVLDITNVFFTAKECIDACRTENNAHCKRQMKLIKDTIDSMRTQLEDVMTSELFINHEKMIAKDLKV